MTDREKLKKIRENLLAQAEDIHEFLNETEPYATIKKAYWEDGKIVVEYEANVDVDILYWFGNKKFSVENNVGRIGNVGVMSIWVGKPDEDWNVQLTGEVDSEPVNVGALEETGKNPKEPETYDFWHGLWDSWNYDGDEFNTTKVPRVGEAAGVEGNNVFVSFSHTWKGKSKQEWEAILRGRASQIEQLDPEKTIILLQDEPLIDHNGFTLEEVQFLYDTAKKYMPDYQFGFSHTRSTINKRELVQSDFIILATYPFFRADYPDIQVWNRKDFDNFFDDHIMKARKKFSGDIFVIGQGFYNPESNIDRKRKWREPPIEAPLWYAEAVERNDLQGLFWWFWRGNEQNVGLSDMPEYFEEVKKLNE